MKCNFKLNYLTLFSCIIRGVCRNWKDPNNSMLEDFSINKYEINGL